MDFEHSIPNEVVDVTELLEERHIAQAFYHIDEGLKNYLSAFSKDYFSELYSDGYFWIMIGEFPISQKVKSAIIKRYIVSTDSGKLKFARWNTLRSKFPNAGYPKVKGENPVFVGFPLPQEEL